MGQCVSGSKRNNITQTFNCQPEGTEDLRTAPLPRLSFEGLLTSVQLQKPPEGQIAVGFNIGKAIVFDLAVRNVTNEASIKWKIEEKFEFSLNEYEMRKKFVQVRLEAADKEEIGKLRINLYLISIGPIHQDFAIKYKDGKSGRIQFNLKISQIIEVEIESIKAEIDLVKKHPGEQFCYSIKTIAGYNGAFAESDLSYSTMVELDSSLPNRQCSVRQLERSDNLRLSRHKSARDSPKLICGNNLAWGTEINLKLPSVKIQILSSELHNTYFQIFLWRSRGEELQQDVRELFADCYVSFHKLFGTEPTKLEISNREFQRRTIKMEQKVWHHGKDAGKVFFVFDVQNEKYIKQHQICVRTEEGILKASPIFGIAETKISDECAELEQLLRISSSSEKKVLDLDKLIIMEASVYDIRRAKVNIEKGLTLMHECLLKSSVKSATLFTYNSEWQLIKAQKILIEIGMKISAYLEEQDPIINDLCWLILTDLMRRGEFTLAHMGFNQKHMKSSQSDGFLQKKQEVATMYKLFLHKLLALALKSLNLKGSECQQTFAQVFCAYAYFSIPDFRRELLNLINRQSDPEITEWRGIEFNLQDDISERTGDANTFTLLFDWQHHFYKCLKNDESIESANISLADTLAQNAWRDRFVKRGPAFFYFIKYWVSYVETSCKHIQEWRYFPGYNRLLRGYLVELKTREILYYPDALVDSGLCLLSNENLLSTFVKILFNKANINDPSTVIKVIEILNKMLKYLTVNHKQIPITFNYIIFFEGIKTIIESDFSFMIYTTLILVYTHFELFHQDFKRSLSIYLLGKMFYKLFLHWSDRVCEVFYHILVYKIYSKALRSRQNKEPPIFQQETIIERFDKLLSILPEHLAEHKRSRPTNQRTLLHRRMKMQLYDKKRRRNEEGMEYFKNDPTETVDVLPSGHYERQNMGGLTMGKHTDRTDSERLTKSVVFEGKKSFVLPTAKLSGNLESIEKNPNRHKLFELSNMYSNLLLRNLLFQNQFESNGVEQRQFIYIERCTDKFNEIKDQMLLRSKEVNAEFTVPILKHDVAIDMREIRPDQIDDW